jgi:hypothetical protein
MCFTRAELIKLVEDAKNIHAQERRISLQSVLLVGELDRHNAAVNMGMHSETFARFVGLTPNQFWKRAQAARVMRQFPQTRQMIEAGETEVSCLALIAPRITQANAELMLEKIKNKSRREVQGVLSRITSKGELLNQEEEFEVRLTLKASDIALLDRAREVLSHGGRVPTLPEIFVKAFRDLLEKRDPMKKAERAAARADRLKPPSPEKERGEDMKLAERILSPKEAKDWDGKAMCESPSPEKELRMTTKGRSPSPQKETRRPAVSQAVRHLVWARDGGRCTWVDPDGSRCPEHSMLELDHVKMWCRGGNHQADNLALRCRRHNQFAAEQKLGRDFMERKRRRRA